MNHVSKIIIIIIIIKEKKYKSQTSGRRRRRERKMACIGDILFIFIISSFCFFLRSMKIGP